MKNHKKNWLIFALFCLGISLFSLYPYILGGVNIEHDTCFHLSRIEGLARSIQSGDLLPRIYPFKNNNFGYAGPMFYSDILLYIPSLLYLCGLSVARCYQLSLLVCAFLSAWFMGRVSYRLSNRFSTAYLSSFLYLFTTYRLTDIFVRGALGEVMAFVFLPLALLGMIEVLWKEERHWKILAFSFAGLLLSHNITFFLACLLFFCLILCYHKNLDQQRTRIRAIFKAILLALGLSSFFLFPMLEQMTSQELILHYYGSNFRLQDYALNAWQFGEFNMNFALSGVSYEAGKAMTTNLGWLIPLLSLSGFFLIRKEKTETTRFISLCLTLGFVFFFISSRVFPWEYCSLLRIIQFPWRFMTLASLLLSVASAHLFVELVGQHTKIVLPLIMSLGLVICINSLSTVKDRTIVLKKNMPYTALLDGSIVDPYYGNSTFVRTEIAGADYLPWPSVDYRTASKCVVDNKGNDVACDLLKKGTTTTFELAQVESSSWIALPITYYKGYQAYHLSEDDKKEKLELQLDSGKGLIKINTGQFQQGTFVCVYQGTWIQYFSTGITLLTCLGCLFSKKLGYFLKKRSH